MPATTVTVLTLACATVVPPMIISAVVTNGVLPEVVSMFTLVVPVFAAAMTLAISIIVLVSPVPITTSSPKSLLTKVTPDVVVTTTLVLAPPSSVFNVPTTAPCVTVAPAFLVISCDVIVNVQSLSKAVFNVPVAVRVLVAVMTLPKITVVGVPPESMTNSTPLTKVTPADN